MSNFFTEIFQSLKKTSTERISNPFYGVMIITWLAFNWEAVAILLFSDMKMDERVRFINSAYSFMNFYPFITAIILTFLLPWCTEKITFVQSKPISRTSTLLAIRKKKMLLADISVERFRAKKDVAYERHKAGEEKEVQDMREAIISSKETTGQLTEELNTANQSLEKQKIELQKYINDNITVNDTLSVRDTHIKSLKADLTSSKHENEKLRLQLEKSHLTNASLEKTLEVQSHEFQKTKSEFKEKIIDFNRDIKFYQDFHELFKDELPVKLRQYGRSEDDISHYIDLFKSLNSKYNQPVGKADYDF
ncbi:hypothetical protein [uncultured Pantoea sp.]|uniref:hypothetical protein n=1 Tax=uncultured Pantoea sp. TaxID=218084 RepID=UPI002805F8A8|nr:hypothetical protein [uncultured Pantoea sp.]